MPGTFSLNGSWIVTPAGVAPHGVPSPATPLSLSSMLKYQHVDEVHLASDAPVNVAFGGVTNAHIIILVAVGGKVRARVTSADGSQQAVPFHGLLAIHCLEAPATAVDLTRVTGTDTTVEVFLGEIAP